MRNILKHFIRNLGECYSRKNILWQLLAVALTYVLIASGFDWW
jgi:hypothetical protein